MRTDGPVTSSFDSRGSPRAPRRPGGLSSTVIALCGEYDSSNADALWDQLTRAIDADDADLALHLGAVTFLDASTLTVFIKARAKLACEDRCFALRALSIPAIRIIEICGLECLVDDGSLANPESC